MITEICTYVGIKPESRRQPNRKVCKQTHEKTGQCGYGSGGSDEITMDLIYAEEICGICGTAVAGWTLARATRVGNNRRVH